MDGGMQSQKNETKVGGVARQQIGENSRIEHKKGSMNKINNKKSGPGGEGGRWGLSCVRLWWGRRGGWGDKAGGGEGKLKVGYKGGGTCRGHSTLGGEKWGGAIL